MNPVNYILLLAADVCGRCIIACRPDRRRINSPLCKYRLNDITQQSRDCECPRTMSLVTYKLLSSFNYGFKSRFFKINTKKQCVWRNPELFKPSFSIAMALWKANFPSSQNKSMKGEKTYNSTHSWLWTLEVSGQPYSPSSLLSVKEPPSGQEEEGAPEPACTL